VLVLASPPAGNATYLRLLAALQPRFRAVALELSAPDPELARGARDAGLVAAAKEAMAALALDRALVVGEGSSARLAVELAIAAPGSVAALVLAAPSPLDHVAAVEVPTLLYRRGRVVEHPALFARALAAFAARVQLAVA